MSSRVFTSWKEIAAYMGKSVRTVQRWEVQLGLPIHRPNSRRVGIVRASQEELDQWMQTRWSVRQGRSEQNSIRVPVDTSIEALHELLRERRRILEEWRSALETFRSEFAEMQKQGQSEKQHGAPQKDRAKAA